MKMLVRDAAESDLDAILAIEQASFPVHKQYTYDDFKLALRELVLVWADGGVCGFIVACCRKEEEKSVILRVAVHPERRGRGIAETLLREVIDRCAAKRIREIEIDVEVVRQGARRLYEKVGFRIARAVPMRDDEFMNDENGTLYLMKLRLNGTEMNPKEERANRDAPAGGHGANPARKPWDPSCPECRQELDRHMELWQAQYDEVDHGAGIYRLLFEHYCTHESRQGSRDEEGVGKGPPGIAPGAG